MKAKDQSEMPQLPLDGIPLLLNKRDALDDDENDDLIAPLTAATKVRSVGLNDDFEFFIPVHGFVRFTEEELEIINHPAFQRLGDIYQLGQSYLVFRGATHKRFEHVLGTVHVAQKIIEAVAHNHARLGRKASQPSNCELCKPFTEPERAFIRLAALLHDIGHLASGHTLEDELDLLPKHDDRERIALVLDRKNWPSGTCRPLREIVDSNFEKYLAGAQAKASDVVISIICKKETLPPGKSGKLRLSVCRDVVGNTICADLLDYLYRDWWHIGKPRYFDERLLQYMEIRVRPTGGPQFVISLGNADRLKTDAVTLIIDLLEARYQLAEAVLFHRTKCSAAAMLERAVLEVYEAVKESGMKEPEWTQWLETAMLDCSDSGLIDLIGHEAVKYEVVAAQRILGNLKCRKLFRQAYTFPLAKNPIVGIRLQETYAEVIGSDGKKDKKTASQRRLEMVRRLEEDFNLPDGSVAIYCPTSGMNAKIAEVKLHVGGHIEPFLKWAPSDPSLGSAHLEAQIARFRRLWRIHVCVDREVWDGFTDAERELFMAVTKQLALGITNTPYYTVAERLARQAIASGSKLFAGSRFNVAARDKGLRGYPTKAPCIRHFLEAETDGGTK